MNDWLILGEICLSLFEVGIKIESLCSFEHRGVAFREVFRDLSSFGVFGSTDFNGRSVLMILCT